MPPVVNVRNSAGRLIYTGYIHLAAKRFQVPVDGLLGLLMVYGWVEIGKANPIYVTFRSQRHEHS